jgi:hypothetical protein
MSRMAENEFCKTVIESIAIAKVNYEQNIIKREFSEEEHFELARFITIITYLCSDSTPEKFKCKEFKEIAIDFKEES